MTGPNLYDATACEYCGTSAHECAIFAAEEGVSDPRCCEGE